MSRSFTPPDTLSQDEIRTIANVRRDIWTNSFQGMGYGSLAGITSHFILQGLSSRLAVLRGLKFNRNTATLALLGGGALGSFLAATVTGKNEVHQLHPIFQVGAADLGEAPQTTADLKHATTEEIREDRRRNRMLRRQSLKETLEHGHGLNDSHGGRWINEEHFPEDVSLEDRHQNRMMRRHTLKSTWENRHTWH